jgi:hypothetical protein
VSYTKPTALVHFPGSAEIPSSRSRAAEIFFSEPGLDRQKFLLIEAGLQRLFFQSQDWIGRNSFFSKPGCRDYFFRARTGSAEIPRSRAAEIIFLI